ncbi:ABC transporter ATP-binding protein [Brackiella oedipodis]|uniref:ABC transporter ATP-binding protein n=1 Tax=Brackiella oedipodis TaxID=124225 RepID=UPI0006891D31|nr:ABC transporter ATP-binding protein [Brackiella oedipodis]
MENPQIQASHSDHTRILQLQDVALGYGQNVVLSDVNLQVVRGQVAALIGGSGSGKSTILKSITGQLKPKQGTVTLLGQDLGNATGAQLSALRRKMGVLFQQGALLTDLNVFENVAFPLRELTSFNEPQITTRVLEKLEAVGLRAAAHLRISEVSGGMARRVALARAIVMEPELILYDEPFAGLDPVSLGMIAALIRRLCEQFNCGALLVTHDIEESFEIVDYVYMIGNGTIIENGTPEQLQQSTQPIVQNFLKGLPADGRNYSNYPVTPAFEHWLETKQARGEK